VSSARRLVLGARVVRSCPKNSPNLLAAMSIMFFVFGCHRDGNGKAGRAKAWSAIDRAKAGLEAHQTRSIQAHLRIHLSPHVRIHLPVAAFPPPTRFFVGS